jgi:hypothetical protein
MESVPVGYKKAAGYTSIRSKELLLVSGCRVKI